MSEEESVTIKSPFVAGINLFNNADDDVSFPDIDFVIPGNEIYRLHRSVLAPASSMLSTVFKTKSSMYGYSDTKARSITWPYDIEEEEERKRRKGKKAKYCEILENWYGFCCNEDHSFDWAKFAETLKEYKKSEECETEKEKEIKEYVKVIAAKDKVKERCCIKMAKRVLSGVDGKEAKTSVKTDTVVNRIIYRDVIVKVLRFCYGEDQTFKQEECGAVLLVLSQLVMNKCEGAENDVKEFMKSVAKNDIVKGVKMLEDCVLVYKVDKCNGRMKSFCEELANIVMRKENMEKHLEVVTECLMKLPYRYLDKNIVGYGKAHSEKSEISFRVKYIEFNESDLDDEVKAEIIKACDVSELRSDELRMIEELDILEDQEMMEMYRKTLKGKEEPKLSPAAEEYLKTHPELKTETRLCVKRDDLVMYCELLKANAIAATYLNLYRDNNNNNKYLKE